MTTTNPITPFKSSDLVFLSNNCLVTDSYRVADYFGKQHSHVLRKIKDLGCSHSFNESNFGLVYKEDQKGEKRPYYQMTKDGFMFLVMGFTGKRAAEIKERYINAFNEMAEKLAGKTKNEIMPVMPPKTLRLLMVMEKGHVVSTQVVPDDCLVFGLSEIPNLLREPGYFTPEQLVKVSQIATEELMLRLRPY
ncbi:Rha family transcriptional regulator [Vibrio cholerae]|uniref:Rha family transcriptional regulator n=1 Tax=Vibrio cholerae TaxID=666 RepID=UPI0012EBA6BF|nr:Rha family transcriptional regulator [Vibrio cholerae]ELO1825448.1 Rha family transcriptional regulator [Vibrio cholerae]MCX9472296.1 Rha family transcriptional regulator [Vibrio cholerae]MCX9484181.1 Rha family transcriptional regulator [Vibrio cholerae]MCX9491241.1 Rha family transcriptional regulator [Vibrio cholerae]MVB21202.1 Rha family transcriptional regulator [Vibrio cholerae]